MIRAAAAVALVCAPIIVLAQTARTEFARGVQIRTDASGNIFRIVLPDDVYDTVARPDLADIRVLNDAGEVVPHATREAPRQADPDAEWRGVAAFPISEPEWSDAVRTQVRIGTDGTVLEVTDGGSPGKVTSAYLVDATSVNEPLARITLSWEPADVTFLARVAVEGSDDLDEWQTLVRSAAIAQLQRDAHTLIQNEIELPPNAGRAKYLRITWPKELAAVTVKTVNVRPRSAAAEREIRWRTLDAERVDAGGAAHYDTRGFLPVEYVDIEFQDQPDVASLRIRSRPSSASEWVQRHDGVFYSLQESAMPVQSQAARIARTTDRLWAVERARDDGSNRERAPRLKVGWHPHEVLFLARGSGPFVLVYGSARTEAGEAPVDAVLANLSESDQATRVRSAAIGEPFSLGGDAALERPLPQRQIALWGVLIVAVVALAFVAIRLFRSTR